jgi:hypothetical protein
MINEEMEGRISCQESELEFYQVKKALLHKHPIQAESSSAALLVHQNLVGLGRFHETEYG